MNNDFHFFSLIKKKQYSTTYFYLKLKNSLFRKYFS